MQHVPWYRQGKGQEMTDYANSDFVHVVNEYVHSELHRNILIDKYVNGYTFEQIAEKHDRSARQVKNIVYRYGDKLFLMLRKDKG